MTHSPFIIRRGIVNEETGAATFKPTGFSADTLFEARTLRDHLEDQNTHAEDRMFFAVFDSNDNPVNSSRIGAF